MYLCVCILCCKVSKMFAYHVYYSSFCKRKHAQGAVLKQLLDIQKASLLWDVCPVATRLNIYIVCDIGLFSAESETLEGSNSEFLVGRLEVL